MKKRILVIIMVVFLCMLPQNVFAMSPPNLMFDSSEVTDTNAVFGFRLLNGGKMISGFEFVMFQNDVMVKSGYKSILSDAQRINITVDMNKDLSLELVPETNYAFYIYATYIENGELEYYRQSFHFTTPKKAVPEETTTSPEEATFVRMPTEEETEAPQSDPAKVVIKSAKNSKKKAIVVKWKKVNNAQKYKIQYASKKTFKKAKTKTVKKLTYTIRKLRIGKNYYVRVRAISGNVKGKWSRARKIKIEQ